MPPVQHPSPAPRKLFAVGGAAFNGVLLIVLFGLMAFVAGSPTRDSLEAAGSAPSEADAPGGGDRETRSGAAATQDAPAGEEGAEGDVEGDVDRGADGSDVTGSVIGDGDGFSLAGATGGGRPAAAQPMAYTASYGSWSAGTAALPPGSTATKAGASTGGSVPAGASKPAAGTPGPGKPATGKPATGKPAAEPVTAKPNAPRTTPTTPAKPVTEAPKPTRRPTCDDFASQPDAQAVFDRDREGLGHMDGDRDGRACEHLPGTPPEPVTPPPAPTPPPVPTIAAVANPPAKFYGLHTREAPWWMGEVDHLARLTGKAPNLNLFFTNFGERFPAAAVDASWNRGMTPVVSWEPIVPGSTAGQPKLRDISNGRLDTYIDAWAAEAAANGKPVVLRFAHEMNGNWYSWSEGVNGNAQGDFVKAWRHVHGRFAAAGADNVLFMWSVNRINSLKTDIADYYPGDAYVDWVGLSAYYRSKTQSASPTFESTFGATLAAIEATAPGKKIFLSEIAAGTDDTARVQWIRSTFDGMAARPDIIGFAWFNDVKTDGDWRIQFSQATVDAFAAGVASERWGSGVLPVGMKPGTRMTVPTTPTGSSPTGGPVDKG
jgi:hypothetical protein